MPRKKQDDCTHVGAEPGDVCRDCGTEVVDPAVNQVRELIREELEKAGVLKKETPPKKAESLYDRIRRGSR